MFRKPLSWTAAWLLLCMHSATAWSENKAAPAAPNLSLEEVVAAAFAGNPELKAMFQDAEAAKTKASRARYWDDPEIGVRFYQVPFEGGFDEIGDIDYIVRQKFPLGGKDKAAAEMAYHGYQHHLHELNVRGREILSELKAAYFELFAVNKMLGVSRELERNIRSVVGAAQARLATNQVSLGDAALGQTGLANLLVERQELLQRRQELGARLNRLMGLAEGEAPGTAAKLDAPRWELDEAESLQLAHERHPTLQGDVHAVEEKEWGVKAAKREYIPDLGVQAEYVQRPGDRVDAFTGELMLNIPLITKKKRLGVNQAEAELVSAQFARRANQNEIVNRVKDSFSRMQSATRTAELTRGTLVPQARQAYQATFSAYSTGRSGMGDVLDASRMLMEAQMKYWKAFSSQAAAVFALEKDVGFTREEYELGKANLPLPAISMDRKEGR